MIVEKVSDKGAFPVECGLNKQNENLRRVSKSLPVFTIRITAVCMMLVVSFNLYELCFKEGSFAHNQAPLVWLKMDKIQ